MLLAYATARLAGWARPVRRGAEVPLAANTASAGMSVVIPSRNGKALLEAQLAGVAANLAGVPGEIVIIDNGSSDGTTEWLRATYPQVAIEVSPEPLSFANAVNRGIRRARFSHVCLLNNDMRIEPGFFAALLKAFRAVPDLFCATAQIRFPQGVRREETGKAVMAQAAPEDFPVRCDEPVAGEDGTWVLYGSGGCSAYDAAKLRALGGVDEAYAPAYVEDLDLGYRAWLRGWPSVYVAGAVVEHQHRATTSRYYTEEQLATVLEINYLKFLVRAVASPPVFRRLWRQALDRLRLRAPNDPAARAALRGAARVVLAGGTADAPEGREASLLWWGRLQPANPGQRPPVFEESLLSLTDGSVACFPGRVVSGKPPALVTARGLEHAMSNDGDDAVLLVRVDKLEPPPAHLLARYVEIVETRTDAAFDAAVPWIRHKWRIED
ncbi:MAG: glycosyltransferase family 2 protein [Bryobacteraceae bacterium]|jgi:GT2 family glycosyltransferase